MEAKDRSAAKPPLGECPLTASHTRRACDNGGSCWCVENPDEVAAINAHPEVRKERSAATASPRRRLPGLGSFVLGLASLAWGIAAQHGASAPWLMHSEHPWHWWVQAAFFLGISVGRWAQAVS